MAADESELTRQLYRTPPARFVAAREAAAAEARRAGDTAAARRLAGSRRPTVAAWLVNLLALDRPELVAELGPLAEALRGAQRDLEGARLRELSGQRRALVAALVTEVRRLAADRPDAPPAARLPLAEVEATLHAALADPGVAGQVRAGRLLKAVHHSGFGEVPRPQLRLVTGGAQTTGGGGRGAGGGAEAVGVPGREVDRGGARRVRDERAAARAVRAERDRRRRALVRELAAARAAQRQAERERDGTATAERTGADALDRIERELADLERRRAAAEQELSRARLARRAAERTHVAARRRTGEVEAAIEALDAEGEDTTAGGGQAD
ncbi:hypothetical protein [Micromonospora rifamycinica]|uniref:Uncharacterized protein n=1 Tax=Micromonospora rifamycinica TaxID=291594 RepID=A0A109IMJ3_9ACTN|nr:hypothetical protein [Micromonospora rifamycinica]KWV33273.1 hypothetical protein AWV63_07780 [Micromonospora rifamycinica]SCG62065.1 hypothetical protein GA0070623_2894 [Micromonospora rifamycinica]